MVENGDVLRLAPGPAEIVDRVFFGRLVADGKALVNAETPVMNTRRRMMHNGVAFATLVIDADGGLAAPPRVTAQGLCHPEEDEGANADLLASAAEAARVAFAALPARARGDDAVIAEAVQVAVRRPLRVSRGKRPLVEVQIVRL